MAINGSDVLLYVKDGATMKAVGSQRDVSFEETSDEIDISSKDSRAKKVMAGRYSSSVSMDALYVPDDTAYTALKSAMRNGTEIIVAKGDNEFAKAVVTSLSESYPDQDGATVSISLAISGEWEDGSGA